MKKLFNRVAPCERLLKIAGLWLVVCGAITLIGLFQDRANIHPWAIGTALSFIVFVYYTTQGLRCYLKHYPHAHPSQNREGRAEDREDGEM